jgi:HPr kinase/phosphorylase
MSSQLILHATGLVFYGRGLLLRGPSGSGKSDLALRLIDEDAALVSDDNCIMSAEEGVLYAAAPATTAGMLEIRGVGLMRVPHVEKAPIDFCFDCVALEQVPRMPEKAVVDIAGIRLPLFKLYPFEVSAVAKIRALLQYSPAHT